MFFIYCFIFSVEVVEEEEAKSVSPVKRGKRKAAEPAEASPPKRATRAKRK